MKDFCNPTLKIAIRKDNSYSVDDLSLISSFLLEQQRNTICWMMKLAFVTNGYHMHKAKSLRRYLVQAGVVFKQVLRDLSLCDATAIQSLRLLMVVLLLSSNLEALELYLYE